MVMHQIGWLVLGVVVLAGCGGGTADATDATDTTDATTKIWESAFTPGLEMRGELRIVRLKGTPYEMGRQHAEFLRDEIIEGGAFVDSSYLSLLETMSNEYGFVAEAETQSYPDILDECRGMADVLGDQGWPLSRCLTLAYGDVVLAHVEAGQVACSQFVATGDATGGGEMIHGRNLDWSNIEFMLDYPVLFVRHPEGRIPYMTVGFPGSVATYNGMNAAGMVVATNMNSTKNDLDRVGRSEVQLVNELLSSVTSLDEARQAIASTDHTAAVIMVVSDGPQRQAAVAEITANHLAFRELDATGIAFATNHFLEASMQEWGVPGGPTESTTARLRRLEQLLTVGGEDSLHGHIDVAAGVSVLRDTYNPVRDKEYPPTQFDNGNTIANNACIYSMVFAPERRTVYLAQGGFPVPTGTYVGLSLDELLGIDTQTPVPAQVP